MAGRPLIPAVGFVLFLIIPYSVYFWFSPGGAAGAALGFVPGFLGIGALFFAGLSRDDCYLRLRMISRQGALVLLVLAPLLAMILPAGSWVGWDVGYAIEGALSGVSQELYFRGALLPAVMLIFPGRLRLAIGLHAAVFVLWHLRMFTEAPVLAWFPIGFVLFAAGYGWGWQVNRDRTLVWAMMQHSLFLVAMSLFGLA
jgi:hypothetical protein